MSATRAMVLLNGDKGVTWSYALAAVEAGLVDEEDLRGCWCVVGGRRFKRWFLA